MQTVYLLRPKTDLGREWVQEHVAYEPYQQHESGAIVVGHRFIDDIVNGMVAAQLELDVDFEVQGDGV